MTIAVGADHLRPGQGQREEHGVARRHVGRRDVVHGGDVAVLRDSAVADQRGAAERREVDVQLDVAAHAQRGGDTARRLDLARMNLAVADGQRVELVAVARGHRTGRVGVETAAEKDDGARARRRDVGAPDELVRLELQADVELVLEDPGRELAGRPSTPCTGENSTAATRPISPCLATTSRANS